MVAQYYHDIVEHCTRGDKLLLSTICRLLRNNIMKIFLKRYCILSYFEFNIKSRKNYIFFHHNLLPIF